jgi:hypothetical protein
MPGRRWIAALLLAVGAVTGVACGRKTLVKPPELVVPERIDNLAASNGPDGIRLVWSRPVRYADTTRMFDLGAFRLERSANGVAFSTLATIEVTDRDRLQQEHRFHWTDSGTDVGQTYRYRVFSLTTNGYVSQPSNVATLERAMPAPTPGPSPTVPGR